jgi:hypothetical protein
MVMRTLRGRVAAAVGGVMLAASPAWAQERATSLDQLRVLVGAGDEITVTNRDGQTVKGRVLSLSPGTLSIAARNGDRTFSDNDINTVSRREGDSLANGAKIGFGIGAGFGFLAGLALAGEVRDSAAFFIPVVAGLYGGLGAGIGVGFDAMIEGDRVIYARAPGRFSVTPIAGKGRGGVRVAWGF